MTVLQERTVRMIRDLSGGNTNLLIGGVKRLTTTKTYTKEQPDVAECIRAFRRLDTARAKIVWYPPEDFEPERELGDARLQRYDSVSGHKR